MHTATSEKILRRPVKTLAFVFLVFGSAAAALAAPEESPQGAARRDESNRHVFRDRIAPHWFHDNTRFWYRNNLRGDTKEFIVVDAPRGTREPAFDHAKLAAGLSKAAGAECAASKLPFDNIEFIDDDKAILFSVGDAAWKCDLNSYECSRTDSKASSASASETNSVADSEAQRRGGRDQRPRENSDRSPDGKWTASVKDHNVFVRSRDDEKEIQLSNDGKEGLAYGRLSWAPDSKTLAAFRIEPGERKEVYLVQSSPAGGGRAKLQTRPYALPGDKFTRYELNLFDVASRKQTKPEVEQFEHEWELPRLHWNRDGHHFAYQQVDRGHQRFRVVEVDSQTGSVRNIIDEKTETFIWTAHTESLRLSFVNWLEKTDEIIYTSERDGWRQLYMVDT